MVAGMPTYGMTYGDYRAYVQSELAGVDREWLMDELAKTRKLLFENSNRIRNARSLAAALDNYVEKNWPKFDADSPVLADELILRNMKEISYNIRKAVDTSENLGKPQLHVYLPSLESEKDNDRAH